MHTVPYIFGWFFAVLSASMAVPLGIAFALNETAAIQAFLAATVVTGFVGGSLILSFKEKRTIVRRKESLLLAALIWVIVPIPAALPFYFASNVDSFVKAYFEAVSGFTTTGASVLGNLSEVPSSVMFFRSFLQWLGGLSTLLFFCMILGPLSGPDRVEPRLQQIYRGQLGSGVHFKDAANTILPIYVGLTVLCFVLLVAAQIPAFDAICLSFATLSTGGFIPRAGTISLYGSPLAELIMAVFMFFGAVSIFWLHGLFLWRWHVIIHNKEPLYIGFAMLALGVILAGAIFAISPEQGLRAFYHSFTLGIATAASIISTSGFAISAQTAEIIPYTVLVFICFIGGGAFSTAGGLKLFRFNAMLKMAARDLHKLIFPHSVLASDTKEVATHSEATMLLAANYAVVVIAMVIISLFLATTDLPFSGALLAAVSVISNIGPAFEQASLPELAGQVYYADLTPFSHTILCAGMILGRIEVLALISLFNIAYWRS